MVCLVSAERIEIWKVGFWLCILKILGGASIEQGFGLNLKVQWE